MCHELHSPRRGGCHFTLAQDEGTTALKQPDEKSMGVQNEKRAWKDWLSINGCTDQLLFGLVSGKAFVVQNGCIHCVELFKEQATNLESIRTVVLIAKKGCLRGGEELD